VRSEHLPIRPLLVASLVAVFARSSAAAKDAEAVLENQHLRVTLDARTGAFTVWDKAAGVQWVPPSALLGRKAEWKGPPACRDVRRIDRPHPGLSFRISLHVGTPKRLDVTVRLLLPKAGRDLCVEMAADADAALRWCVWPVPIVPEKGPSWLVTTAYNGGMLYPLVKGQVPRYGGWELPFFGVTNIAKGFGYACIYQTPFDVRLHVSQHGLKVGSPLPACVAWSGCKGKWAYTRKLRYRFVPKGGYVAVAKAYRAYAKQQGILRTLRQKMKRRPAIARLMGAPNIWGGRGLAFCREAKAAGIDRMLINGSFGRDDTEAIKKLGYLVSCYDNYEDIMPGKPGRAGDCKVPDDQVLLADGKRMLAWPVHAKDPKTGRTKLDPKTGKPVVKERYVKRCSVLYPKVARKWIPPDQAKHPRNARFIDVTTACGLRECYDPNHPCTRGEDSKVRCELARYVGEELGLVLGGEHGVWWGVPYYDYWEGMQSGGFYSWPAGHVGMDLPQKREEIGRDYLTYGIGHAHRIPLWELIFGDCTVSYWYWGDSTGHLYHAAPEITAKKDLFNMLYGTLPLYWVSRPFGLNWTKPELRKRLLESYRNVCKLHEHTGLQELVNHEWLTEDRAVQKSTFADGTFVVVNFGQKNVYNLRDQGKTWPIAPLGFYARGPKVHQYRLRKDSRDVTYVHAPGYWFADGSDKVRDFGAIRTRAGITIRRTPEQCVLGGATAAVCAAVRSPGIRQRRPHTAAAAPEKEHYFTDE